MTPRRAAPARPAQEQVALLAAMLRREAERGYDNGTVIGGFDELWAQLPSVEDAVRTLKPLGGARYSTLLPAQRKRWHLAVDEWRASQERAASGRARRAADGAATAEVGNGKQPGASRAAVDRPSPPHANGSSPPYPATPREVAPSAREASRVDRDAAPVLPKGSGIDTRIADLTQVHHTRRQALGALGLETLRDALRHFPLRHIDYTMRTPIRNLMPDTDATIVGEVLESRHNRFTKPPSATVRIRDDSGSISVRWFNMPFMADRWKAGDRIVLSGQVTEYRGRPQLTNPEYDDLTLNGREVDRALLHAGTLVPVYPLTEGLNQRTVRAGMAQVLALGLPAVRDALPEDIRLEHQLDSAADAIRHIHTPSRDAELRRGIRRMAFDECLYNQLAALQRRLQWRRSAAGAAVEPNIDAVRQLVEGLDFELTGDQRTVLRAVLRDLRSGEPMARLIQGEVGSGKTVVAIAAMLAVAADDGSNQAALMAPTEVLADQHFLNLIETLHAVPAFTHRGPVYESQRFELGATDGSRPLRIGLLTGSLSPAAKRDVQRACASGDVDLIVGTHALLQDAVDFRQLSLLVVDEQHRFGTEQRAALTRRTPRPHLLAMSATPIPRTLHMVMYGDMDVSELRQMPHGRRQLATHWVRTPMEAVAAFNHMRAEVGDGRQCFVVCPLIDPSESADAAAATETHGRLRVSEFPDAKVELLHGRMGLKEKQAVMERFRLGISDVLVATTVIEVGVDVPNATVMLVLDADRFGLSQLHQLRGRVGRGEHAGTCYLVADPESEVGAERMQALVTLSDGFELATKDLQMRGPGRNLAVEQSGWSGWRFAKFTDLDLIREARAVAEDILRGDPGMTSARYRDLRRSMARAVGGAPSDFA